LTVIGASFRKIGPGGRCAAAGKSAGGARCRPPGPARETMVLKASAATAVGSGRRARCGARTGSGRRTRRRRR
jgi:hypothetical protein